MTKEDCAWVTLATNDTYAIGALVLAESLKRAHTKYPMHIMITKEVTRPVRDLLAKYYRINDVNILDSEDGPKLALLARPELGCTFTKLHCWTLTQYKKAVFVDADAVVLKNCDELFEHPEISGAPDTGWPDTFNSGVFVFVPSVDTFRALLKFATNRGSYDGGDQGLLNMYFKDWYKQGPEHRLPFAYNMNSSVAYTYLAAYEHFGKDIKIVHFLGKTKPWHHKYDMKHGELDFRVGCLSRPEHVEFWWRTFTEAIDSRLPRDLVSNWCETMQNTDVSDNGNGNGHKQNNQKDTQCNDTKSMGMNGNKKSKNGIIEKNARGDPCGLDVHNG